jgi:hypothetical protein
MRIKQEEFDQITGKAAARKSRFTQPSKSNKPNKYGAIKTDGCDSKKESLRLRELRLLQKAGKIFDLIPQVRFELISPQQDAKTGVVIERAVNYTCDAMYVETGRLVVEETKSEATKKARDWQIRRKLMLERFGIEIREV